MDGLWYMSQLFTWAHFQHTGYQKSGRTLPSDDEYVISLHNAATASCIAIAWHFFKDAFDKYDPSISETIYRAIDRQILTPFFSREQDSGSHRIWTGFEKAPGKKLNNWTPFCDHHVLVTFLLMERDPERLLKALERSVKIIDFYMSDQKSDGACDEGPGYWAMSFGKVYDFARTLKDASYGQADVFSDPLIKRMGEYKSKTYMDGGWMLAFGDCEPRDIGSPGLLFRFGHDVGSEELMKLAVYLTRDKKTKAFRPVKIGLRLDGTLPELETIRYHSKMTAFEDSLPTLTADIKSVYYPESDYAVLRRGKWNLGCKGSHNGESHNHNDVGSAILIWDGMPVIYDCGVGIYTKDTFGPGRYSVWTMQSGWHATPSPNGVMQRDGAQFAAKNSSCDVQKRIFSTDISGAYPPESCCREWRRTWSLSDNSCTLNDRFSLSKRTAPDELNFVIRGEVALPGEILDGHKAGKGEVLLKIRSHTGKQTGIIRVKYSSNLTAHKEIKEITDKRLHRCAGDSLTRLQLKSSAKAPLKGAYAVSFECL